MKVRYTMKYMHTKGCLAVKITDDVSCVQFCITAQDDMRTVLVFLGNLMGHMASSE